MTGAAVTWDDHGLAAALAALSRELSRPVAALSALGVDVERVAHEAVPVLTGALAATISAHVSVTQVVVQAGGVVDYAAPQNAGVPSRHIPATHFFDQAEDYARLHGAETVAVGVQALINRLGL